MILKITISNKETKVEKKQPDDTFKVMAMRTQEKGVFGYPDFIQYLNIAIKHYGPDKVFTGKLLESRFICLYEVLE